MTDVDEYDPLFGADDYPATVAENIADTVVIATVSATEDDLTGTVSYSITGGDPGGLFEVDSSLGVVSLAAQGGFLSGPVGVALETDGSILVAEGSDIVRVDPATGTKAGAWRSPFRGKICWQIFPEKGRRWTKSNGASTSQGYIGKRILSKVNM